MYRSNREEKMRAGREFQDRFAQMRQIDRKRKYVNYWRNNININRFKYEDGQGMVLRDAGEYNGLRVDMTIRIISTNPKMIFSVRNVGPVQFRGTLDHMGIMVSLNRKLIGKKICGQNQIISYSIMLAGSGNKLSFINDTVRKRQG